MTSGALLSSLEMETGICLVYEKDMRETSPYPASITKVHDRHCLALENCDLDEIADSHFLEEAVYGNEGEERFLSYCQRR